MKVLRNSIGAAVITMIVLALFTFVFGGNFKTSAAERTTMDTVSYMPIPAGAYNLDPAHTVIGFGVKHLEIAVVEGRFKDFKGTINFDDKDVTKSTVEFTAKIDSIDTGVTPRNEHLRTADFFDAAKYPEMTFKSTRVEKKGKSYVLYGDLTIKDVTKPVAIPFTITGAVKDPWGGTRFGVEASTTINRRDFGINYGNALPIGGFDVANEVAIKLHLEAVKSEPKASK
jgi:polyisoprenoid-binding protein YceI